MRIIKLSSLLLIFISTNIFAKQFSADFCKHYPKFENGKRVLRDEQVESENQIICFNGEAIEYNMTEISTDMNNVEEYVVDLVSDEFKKQLYKNAINETLKKRSEYYNLFNGIDYSFSDVLNECRESHKKNKSRRSFLDAVGYNTEYNPLIGKEIDSHPLSSQAVNKEQQRDFISINLINSIKAQALLEINNNHEENMDDVYSEYNQSNINCNIIYESCMNLNKGPICITNNKKCYKESREIRDARLNQYSMNIKPLHSMVGNSPLLFSNLADGEVFSSLSTDDLEASTMLKEFNKVIPNKFIRRAKFLIEQNDKQGLRDFFSENASELNNIIDDKSNYKKLSKASTTEIKKELSRIDSLSEKLCDIDSNQLHANPDLVNFTLNQMYSKAKNKDSLKNQVRMWQAGYCHLLDKEPISDGGSNLAAIGGFVLLGIGVGLQFIPVAGNAIGYGLIAGGVALSGIGVVETVDKSEKLKEDIALYSAGFGGYKNILDSKEDLASSLKWSIADAVLLPLDLHALKAMKNSNKIKVPPTSNPKLPNGYKRYDHEQRAAIDKIEKDLGRDFKRLNNKYNPDNVHELSKADKVYFAGVAKMLEKDLIKTTPSLKENPKLLKEKMDEQLDTIIKDCKGEKS